MTAVISARSITGLCGWLISCGNWRSQCNNRALQERARPAALISMVVEHRKTLSSPSFSCHNAQYIHVHVANSRSIDFNCFLPLFLVAMGKKLSKEWYKRYPWNAGQRIQLTSFSIKECTNALMQRHLNECIHA